MRVLFKSDPVDAQRRIPFKAVDAVDKVTPETGLVFAAGELKFSKNGATEANTNGSVVEIARGLYYYQTTTGEIDTVGFVSLGLNKAGVHPDFFVAEVRSNNMNGVIDANVKEINANALNAQAHAALMTTIILGTVETTPVAATTTTFQAVGFTETTADHFNGRQILWTAGVMAGSAARIIDYAWDGTNSQGIFTVSTMQEAPPDGTNFRIV